MVSASVCNLCGVSLVPRFENVLDPQTRETFAIESCPRCGLGHTTPQPEDLGPYYGPAYHGARHGMTARFCVARRVHLIQDLVGGAHGRSLLDVGCGDGSFLAAMHGRGWRVMGTEMNPREGIDKGLTVRASLEEIKPFGPFGCITLWRSLEHLRDPRRSLAQLAGMLEPDGTLIAAVPDAGGYQAQAFGRFWHHLDVPRHLFHFNRRALNRALELSGLVPFRRWHQELEYDLIGWTQSALNAILPTPNAFFYGITGKPTSPGTGERVANTILAPAFTSLAVPAVAAGTILGRGGTLIMAARPRANRVADDRPVI